MSLRIALVGPIAAPLTEPVAGGLERLLIDLARGLQRRGHTVRLFGATAGPPDLDFEAITPTPLSSDRRIADDCPPEVYQPAFIDEHITYLTAAERIRADDHDIVHSHATHYLPLITLDRGPAPLLTTLHLPPNPWQIAAARRSRAHFVCLSTDHAHRWRPHLPRPPHIVFNGVDTHHFAFASTPGPEALWVGRLVPEKGCDDAIAAAKLAGIRLHIAGPIDDTAWFTRAIEPHLGERVRYLGHLDRDALAAAYRRHTTCLVTPKWDEPFGLVVLEALASGTPVAGYRRGALPELVTEGTGRLVEGDSVEALAAALIEASACDRASCRAHAQRLDIDGMVGRYEALYEEIIRAERAP